VCRGPARRATPLCDPSDVREAPPRLWCVPGLGLEAGAWAPTLDALPGYDARVVPLPGFGRRPAAADDVRPGALGERLADLLDDLRPPVVLAGHSASCQVVAEAAARAPGRVAALVLVGPTTDPRAASWPRLAARWLRTACWEDPGQVPFLVSSYRRTGLVRMLRTMDVARHEDLRPALLEARCPVLVVRGRHDRICPADWAADVAASAPPDSRAVTLRAGGHMVPLTCGELVAEQVRRLSRAPWPAPEPEIRRVRASPRARTAGPPAGRRTGRAAARRGSARSGRG
jgi:pimeloyl-ACP methyl ester carboxylesterase